MPNRPYSRSCCRYTHRWYLCALCPERDFCGVCAEDHNHPCTLGPVHDEVDTCGLCGSIDVVEDVMGGYDQPWAPARPHPDHAGEEPSAYLEFYAKTPGPHYTNVWYDSDASDCSDGRFCNDNDTYHAWYPGPYKDEYGCVRRPEWSKTLRNRNRRWSGDRLAWIQTVFVATRALDTKTMISGYPVQCNT